MRIVAQRVKKASVEVNGSITGQIGLGLLVLVGFEEADSSEDILWMSGKLVRLRVFDDESGVMNRSVSEVDGDILVVSQFTLHASTKKGNRPSYIRSARPEVAVPLYEEFVNQISSDLGKMPQTGVFGAHMEVSLINDGPVTIIIDTKNKE
jgi:D-tyrosyl-tRNA(Tyr) deacylase